MFSDDGLPALMARLHDVDGAGHVAGEEAEPGGAVVTGQIGPQGDHFLIRLGRAVVIAQLDQRVA